MTQPTEYASVNDLLADEISGNTRDVTLPNGKVITVRGLSRAELLASGKGTDDAAEIERRNIVTCMVRPTLTYAQATEWQRQSPPAVLAVFSAAVRDLSGLGEGADKSSVAEARD